MFIESLKLQEFEIQDSDVIVITSKVYSMEQQSAVVLDTVEPTPRAIELAEKSKLDPRIAQLVLDESNGEVYGAVYKAILAKTDSGLSSNAGIDQSNCPEGYALLLPAHPDKIAQGFRKRVKEQFNIDVAVIVTDSKTIPLKIGSSAIAIGIAGIEPIIDENGKPDLYGEPLTLTRSALADNLATAANLIMGESNERTPFGIIRGLDYVKGEDVSVKSTIIPEKYCLYFAPLLELIDPSRISTS
ncbi:MAG: coenzyme F420-0:L-glutamate ligase [Candidatus Heimdallarchaeota archaeon]|nr:coenzyme F420-0:L-glutamate ligase [Candidatus Heimdallarchaeota archaeon]